MLGQWITNEKKAHLPWKMPMLVQKHKVPLVVGPPEASQTHSVEALENFGLVGIYMEKPDVKEGPDPNCQECKGTGIITLFTSSSPCGCTAPPEKYEDRDYGAYYE